MCFTRMFHALLTMSEGNDKKRLFSLFEFFDFVKQIFFISNGKAHLNVAKC